MGPSLWDSRVMVVYSDDPAQKVQIDQIRRMWADFIDAVNALKSAIEENQGVPTDQEQGRLYSLAFTTIEEAVMWSIKAVTKKHS